MRTGWQREAVNVEATRHAIASRRFVEPIGPGGPAWVLDVVIDCIDQLLYASEGATRNGLLCDAIEPEFVHGESLPGSLERTQPLLSIGLG